MTAGDEPRFLGRATGYARHPTIDSLEAVGAAEQRRQTDEAHIRWRRRMEREWELARKEILTAVDSFSAVADTRLRHHLRPIRRQVDRISRELGV